MATSRLSPLILFLLVVALTVFPGKRAECLEVTLVMNTPGKEQITGTLKEVTEDGAITLIRAYGEETFTSSQYLSATCPQPTEHSLAEQSYLKREYAKALELYQEVNRKYELLGWGAASLEGISKSQLQMGNVDAAIESYSKLLELYPDYSENRAVKFSLAQACEVKQKLAWAVDLYGQVAVEGDDEISALAYRNIGNIHYGRKNYNDALLNYLRVAIVYRIFPRAPVAECAFKAADCFEKLASEETSPEVAVRFRERAKKYYLEVITGFPQSDFAKQAQSRYQLLTGGASTRASPIGESPSVKAGGPG